MKKLRQICTVMIVLVLSACPYYDPLELSMGELTIQEALGYKSDGPYIAVTTESKHYQFPDSSYAPLYDGTMYGTAGNGDGLLNPGETVVYDIKVANYGKKPAQGVNAVISTGDSYISYIENTSGFIGFFKERYKFIPSSKIIFDYNREKNLRFTVSPDTPPGRIIKFDIIFSDAYGNTWRDYFLLTVSHL